MSRLGTGLGFARDFIFMLGGGSSPTEIYDADVSSFSGANNMRLNLGTTSVLKMTDVVSIDAYISRQVSASSNQLIAGNLDFGAGTTGYALWYAQASNLLVFQIYDSLGNPHDVYATIDIGAEAHIHCFFDGTQLAIYKDGILAESEPYIGSMAVPVQDFTICGANYGSNGYAYSGLAHNVSVFHGVLTESERNSLHDGNHIARCIDLWDNNAKSLCVLNVPMCTYTGFTTPFVDQSSSNLTITEVGTIPLTGSAQIECEA